MQPLDAGDPTRIGPYAILGVLGSGGMGKVYLGRSTGGRTVAVKAVRPELADDLQFRQRFRNEIEAAKSVSGAFTAAVVDSDTEASVPWFATAFIAGISLGDAVARFGALPEPALRTLTAGLAEAITAIHRTGIIHRDLKPANVLLALDGPYVIDFGITRATEGTALTTAGTVMGSPGFMSPEQASGVRVGPETDMFSLGATLVYAATARSPFGDGPTPALLYRVVSQEPDITGVPTSLRDMIAACLHKEPARRPTTQQILEYLDANAPAPTTGGWLPPAYTDAIVQASSVMTHMGANAGPAGHLGPQGPNTTPPYGAPGYQGPGTPPQGQGTYPPAYAQTAQSGMMGVGPYGPGPGTGPQGAYNPNTPGKMSRRALFGIAGAGVVVLGGGATAIALSGGSSKQAGGTTGGGGATTPTSGASGSSSGSNPSPSSPASGGVTGPSNSAPVNDPNTAASNQLGGAPQANAAFNATASDPLYNSVLSKNTLVLIGVNNTHGLDTSLKKKWPDIACGCGTISDMACMDPNGTTLYTTGGDSTGHDQCFAIDVNTGKVLWSFIPFDSSYELQGAAGTIGDLVIFTANVNVQGDTVFAVSKTTHKIVWKQLNNDIGCIHVPAAGKFIFTGHEAPSSDTDSTVTGLDVTTGNKVWQVPIHLATMGTAGSDYFADDGKSLFTGAQKLMALDPATGATKWQTIIGDPTDPALINIPFTDGSGRVYVTASGYLAAVDAGNGKVLWQSALPNSGGFSITGAFATGDGQVYVTDQNKTLYAVDAKTGKCNWSYNNALMAGQDVSTLVGGGGKVFYSAGEVVLGFNANGK